MAMIAITTNNSISVNAERRRNMVRFLNKKDGKRAHPSRGRLWKTQKASRFPESREIRRPGAPIKGAGGTERPAQARLSDRRATVATTIDCRGRRASHSATRGLT